MDNKVHSMFGKIKADDALKGKTLSFINQEIERRSRTYSPRIRLAAVCASFVLLMLFGGFSYNLYYTPSAYIDLDVNPSIELNLNRFGRVLEASPYNADGGSILKDVDVRHKKYEQAVETLLSEMIARGYLESDGLVSVTVQTDKNTVEAKILEDIQSTVSDTLDSRSYTADIFAVSQETRNHAHDYNLSPAKYLAIVQLQEVDPTASFEGCAGHSINEIKQFTRSHGGGHHGGMGDGQNSESQDESAAGNRRGQGGHGHR